MNNISLMSEEEWEELKANISNKIRLISIKDDISIGVAKKVLGEIDNYYTYIRLMLADIRSQKESLDIIIRELERSEANGSNEIQRKQNATKYIQNYRENPQTDPINLYDEWRKAISRYEFIESIVDVLIAKQGRLITLTGLLKLEKDLLPGTHAHNS